MGLYMIKKIERILFFSGNFFPITTWHKKKEYVKITGIQKKEEDKSLLNSN